MPSAHAIDAAGQAVAPHDLEELPVARVAEVMGCAPGTVKAQLHRARQRLSPREPSTLRRHPHRRTDQVRRGGPGKLYLRRKLAEHKTSGEAMPALERQLSDVIYRRLIADLRRREAVRGGQTGTELASA